jgi:basic membrane protein A
MKPVPFASLIIAAILIASGCGTSIAETPLPTDGPVATVPIPGSAAPGAAAFRVGQVTDLGGIDDKSFNALAWAGAQRAAEDLGVDAEYAESHSPADYPRNIQRFLDQGDDLIITVGYLLAVDTALAARAFPDTKFAIVDNSYPDCGPGTVEGIDCGSATELPNARGLTFQTDEAAFLAGYAAAGMTKTAAVGTFGGQQIPTVTIFMNGFEAGVKKYNEVHGSNVQVLGWDSETATGAFAGNFESQEDGRAIAESLIKDGADIIMPVAGPVGLGTAAVCQETRSCLIIGVDDDWYVSAFQYKDVILTSVLKRIDVAVYDTIKNAVEGKFSGGTVVYTLKDGGVDIAPFHDFDSQVPAELKAELQQLKADIINNVIEVGN